MYGFGLFIYNGMNYQFIISLSIYDKFTKAQFEKVYYCLYFFVFSISLGWYSTCFSERVCLREFAYYHAPRPSILLLLKDVFGSFCM